MKVNKELVIILLIAALATSDAGFELSNYFQSAKNIGTGLAKSAPDILPSAKEIFEIGKNVLTGYPLEVVFDAIHQICSTALASDAIKPKITPDINNMSFQLRTPCGKYFFPLLKADEMWTSKEFDKSKKVVLLASGWTTNANESNIIETLAKAFLCRGDVNFVALDAADYVDTLYTWSAFNTEEIGQHVAAGLVKLIEIVPLKNIYLIGHSLGAHIVGYAGRNFNYRTGKTIPRITGLDPAKICFNEGESLSGLLRGDADWVDIIHSNPGVLGKSDPIGDVDFYPGGLKPIPNGCYSVPCAHERSWMYFAESVYPGNERNFLARRCTSSINLSNGKCTGVDIPMGYALPSNVKGNYFLEVNKKEPFGINGTSENIEKYKNCGLCNSKKKA